VCAHTCTFFIFKLLKNISIFRCQSAILISRLSQGKNVKERIYIFRCIDRFTDISEKLLLQARELVESKLQRSQSSRSRYADPTRLLFLRNIYILAMCAYSNRRNNIRVNVLCKGNRHWYLYVEKWEFVRNEIFTNGAPPMGFSHPSTSSYLADGKLYSAIHKGGTILRFHFPDFVVVDKKRGFCVEF